MLIGRKTIIHNMHPPPLRPAVNVEAKFDNKPWDVWYDDNNEPYLISSIYGWTSRFSHKRNIYYWFKEEDNVSRWDNPLKIAERQEVLKSLVGE